MIRRFLTRALLLVLIAACGYNWLQMQELQQQVAELRAGQTNSLPKLTRVKRHPPEARLSLSSLQSRWKHLRNQANAFRSTSKKVFHEII